MPVTIQIPAQQEVLQAVNEVFAKASLEDNNGKPDAHKLSAALADQVDNAVAASVDVRDAVAVPLGTLISTVLPDLDPPGSQAYENSRLAQEVWKNCLARVNNALKIATDGNGLVQTLVRQRHNGHALLRVKVKSTGTRGTWGYYISDDPDCLIEDGIEPRTDKARLQQDEAARMANTFGDLQPANRHLYGSTTRKKLEAGTTRAIAALNAGSNGTNNGGKSGT